MLYESSLERYGKLKRDFVRLMKHFDSDGLDNFIQTANSLRDWVNWDGTQEQKAALGRFVVDGSLDWQICNQLANGHKHGSSRRRPGARRSAVHVPRVTVSQVRPGGTGFAVPPSMRVFGAGDEVVIEFDGTRESALGFVVRTFRHFHYIFELVPFPPDKRVVPSLMELLGT